MISPTRGGTAKYYYITEEGKQQYQYYVDEWKKYRIEVEDIILGGLKNE